MTPSTPRVSRSRDIGRLLLTDDRGAQLAEYGLLAVLIGAFLVVSVAFFGDSLLGLFGDILNALPF